jgi:hypothetical protein
MKTFFAVFVLLATAGCATNRQIISTQEFAQLSHMKGLGHFYYTGSDGETNYYAASYFLQPTRIYSYPQSNYPISHRMLRTKDRDSWRPFLININENIEGFTGEEPKTMNSSQSEKIVEHAPPAGRGEAPRP